MTGHVAPDLAQIRLLSGGIVHNFARASWKRSMNIA